jgi:hypothetical protein
MATFAQDKFDEHSDCIVIDDLTVIGEKETIDLLRADAVLFNNWKCAQPEEVSVIHLYF